MSRTRLVAQGHRQIEGIDHTETFSPVVRYDSVRVFLALSACLRLTVHQVDANTAFLNSPIGDAVTVYVRQPPQFVDRAHPDYVWQLKGAMYGAQTSASSVESTYPYYAIKAWIPSTWGRIRTIFQAYSSRSGYGCVIR